MSYGFSLDNDFNDYGYVGNTDNSDTIYFARRNVKTIENVVKFAYILNNKSGLTLRVRHYWSGNNNKDYYQLQENGDLVLDTDYEENHNNNYNAFTVDFVYRWIFAPGSELTFAWKNSIYCSGDQVVSQYFENLNNTWKSDQTNSLSIKMLYYLDYNNLIDGILQNLEDQDWAKTIYADMEASCSTKSDYARLAQTVLSKLGDERWSRDLIGKEPHKEFTIRIGGIGMCQ